MKTCGLATSGLARATTWPRDKGKQVFCAQFEGKKFKDLTENAIEDFYHLLCRKGLEPAGEGIHLPLQEHRRLRDPAGLREKRADGPRA